MAEVVLVPRKKASEQRIDNGQVRSVQRQQAAGEKVTPPTKKGKAPLKRVQESARDRKSRADGTG